MHVFRYQEVISQNVNRDGIVRNQALEPDSYHRKCFIHAERTSQLASQLKQQANFRSEVISQNVNRDGIVRNQALEPDSYHRKCFIHAERTSQLASQLKQQANL